MQLADGLTPRAKPLDWLTNLTVESWNRQMKPSELPKLLFSVEEAASVLSISPWTVRSHIKRGSIPTVRIGDRQLITTVTLNRIATEGLKSL